MLQQKGLDSFVNALRDMLPNVYLPHPNPHHVTGLYTKMSYPTPASIRRHIVLT